MLPFHSSNIAGPSPALKQIYLPNSNAQVRTFRRALLTGVETTILDEIHAVVGNRRGDHLITAVDRLVRLSGEFHRIALSATVRPLEKVAEFIGGLQVTGAGPEPRYTPPPAPSPRSDPPMPNATRFRTPPMAMPERSLPTPVPMPLPARYREAANAAKPIMRSGLRW